MSLSAEIKRIRISDVRAFAQLITQAIMGVAELTEGVHQAVRSTLGLPAGRQKTRASGITGFVYKSVRGVTRLAGGGTDSILSAAQALLEPALLPAAESLRRESVMAALNGVIGDRLAADQNSFAIPMSLRYQDQPLDWQALPVLPESKGKILVLIHGLCMNDLYRHAQQQGREELGQTLAKKLGYVPVYVRYNTGLNLSHNGQQLAQLLEELSDHWPSEIEELSVVAHSMGGLLIRSAIDSAREQGMQWPERLKNVVFLGTPHHGAPLERAGNWLTGVLDATPFSRPFVALAQVRSAGITDLRYGKATQLPEGIFCFTVAATTADQRSILADRLVGDGLVPLNSALGYHDNSERSLSFPPESQWIAYRTGHIELLSQPEVGDKIMQWLKPDLLQ